MTIRAFVPTWVGGFLLASLAGCTLGFGRAGLEERTDYDPNGQDGGTGLKDAGLPPNFDGGPSEGGQPPADAGTPDLNIRFAEESISLPGRIDFPLHHRGRAASEYAFTLHNPSDVSVAIRSLELVAAEYPQDLPAFTLEGSPGSTILAPNGELELAIRFSPQGGFPHGAKLVVGTARDDLELEIYVPVGRAMAVLGGQNGYRVVINLEPPFLPSTSVRIFTEAQVDWESLLLDTSIGDGGPAVEDGGLGDGGLEDGGLEHLDAGTADAGLSDASAVDGGTFDGGMGDAVELDAGGEDAGDDDAGPNEDSGVPEDDAGAMDGGSADANDGSGNLADAGGLEDGDGGFEDGGLADGGSARIGGNGPVLRNGVDTQMRSAAGEGRIFVFGAADPALGPRARLMWSADGLTWTKCISRRPADSPALRAKLDEISTGCTLPDEVTPLRGVATGNGLIVALSTHESLTSTDGLAFVRSANAVFSSSNNEPAPEVEGVVFGGGYFLAFGGVRTAVSTDGITWSSETTHPFRITAAAYGAGTWLIVGENEGRNISVEAGSLWEDSSLVPEGSVRFTDATHTGEEFVALTSLRTWRSLDGQVWERRSNQGRPLGLCQLPGGDELVFVEVVPSTLDESSQLSMYRSTEPLGPVPGQSSPFYSSEFPTFLSYKLGCGDVLYTRVSP